MRSIGSTMRRMAGPMLIALAATAAATPAFADPPWERGWRGHGPRYGHWAPRRYYPGPPVYYAPPPRVYYAPPPVYYAPPPVYYPPPAYVAPGFSFGFNIPIR